MRALVTGGAGYIGSFMTKKLLGEGHEVVVIDSLEKGHKEAIDTKATFVQGNLLDSEFVSEVFKKHSFDVVLHFAAYISVGESMQIPGRYFENNVLGTVTLLESMVQAGVKKFVFSSTAGVYGNPTKLPIPEEHPKNPTNPYGESKLLVERILPWYHKVYDLGFVVLRYFNAAGASLDGVNGEGHFPETHIIPSIMRAALSNKEFMVYGTDYNTTDGTCVRDYIHVLDLAEAHILAMKKLFEENGSYYYNVGTGKGYSNKEIVDMVKKVISADLKITYGERRAGDPDALVADAKKIREELGFSPKYSDLETIVSSAWKWHAKQKDASPMEKR